MSYRSWSPLACVIASLIAVAPPAHAVVDCADPGLSAPWNGETDLPTNTLIRCTPPPSDSSGVQLMDAQGAPVSGTQSQIMASEYELLVFRPDVELASHAQYRFRCSDAAVDPSPLALSSFTTGEGPRHDIPALPDTAVTSTSVTRDVEGLGPAYYVTFSGASPAGTILVIDRDGTAALDASQPSGTITDSAYTPYLQTTPIGIGRGPCSTTWSEAGPGASALVRVGAFDVTGAFSGWTEPTRVTIPDDAQGCQFGASTGSWKSAGLLAALACMLARRERRPRRNEKRPLHALATACPGRRL
jgi:hypothetical protein